MPEPQNYVRFVGYIARRIYHQVAASRRGHGDDVEDLVAAGCLGLVKAAPRFDPERGVAFSTFAFFHIRGAIWDYVHKEGTLIPLSRRCREQLAEVEWAREQMRQRWGQEPTAEHLAAALGLSLAQLHELENCQIVWDAAEELDTPARAPGPAETTALKEQQMRKRQLVEDLETCITALPWEDRVIVTLREYEDLTLQEVAQVLRMSKDAVYRRQQKARAQLRAALQAAGWDVEDVAELLEVESAGEA